MGEEKQNNEVQAKNPESIEIKGALILPRETAEKLFFVLNELPRKFNGLINPLMEDLTHCFQSDVVITPPKKEEKQ